MPTYKPAQDPKMVRVIAGGIIAIVMIIGLSIFLTMLNKQTDSTEVNPSASPSQKDEKEESYMTENEKQTLVKDILSEVKESAMSIDDTDVDYVGQDIYDTDFPIYLANGAKTAMPLEKSFGFIITANDNSELIKSMVGKASEKLTELDFEEYEDIEQNISGEHGWINTKKKIVCTPIKNNLTSMSLSCGHTSWLSAEKIALGNALAEAYKAKEEKYPTYISANPQKIENSPYQPYQKLIASIQNFAGLFYRSSSDADWVYFASTQAALPCKDYYADQGARHAFQGDVCLDADGQNSTVEESNSSSVETD